VQSVLAGMPDQAPALRLHRWRGECCVSADQVLLFGPYAEDDAGMRNLGLVTLRQIGFSADQVAAAFQVAPRTVRAAHAAYRKGGSAAVVKPPGGRPRTLTDAKMAQARALLDSGLSQRQIAARLGVTQPAISIALRQQDPARQASQPIQGELGTTPPARSQTRTQTTSDADARDTATDADAEADAGDTATDAEAEAEAEAGDTVSGVAGGGLVLPRLGGGVFRSRYAGSMLLHAYLDRVNAAAVLSGLRGAAGRLFDQVHITAFTVLALALRIDSIEGVKTLVRTEAGPLVGAQRSPELHTLRPRLSAIADLADIPALQAGLARAMLALNGQSAGIYYVDDHFVPYGGAKPVAKGHNGKRDRCEKGRADTLFTDERGRAVCFTTAEPSSLAKTMQPGLAQLRAIVPGGKILLGFDRGGAYAEAFTACRARDIDFVTYRRGALAATTAAPAAHQIRRGRDTISVVLADETISFRDYDGPVRQLTLYERPDTTGCTCPELAGCTHLRPVLQILTSDLDASAPSLLFALKGRWIIENAFKYLDFYGIDWLVDYHAQITGNAKLIRNPARDNANAAIRAARAGLAEAERTLGAIPADPALTIAEKNTAIRAAEQKITAAQHNVTTLTTARDKIPTELPANVINPGAQRALLRARRRGLVMVLRLLAYNADTWLADHLNAYLQDNNEYRALTRSLMHQAGTITYTPQQVTVTLDRHHQPRLNRALACLADELNHTPPRIPGDHRPIIYQLSPADEQPRQGPASTRAQTSPAR
jgi:hypothetical protein